MLWKPIFILVLLPIAFGAQTPHLKTPAELQNDPSTLPRELTETETQTIKREQSPKPHIDAALRVSDARINSALKSAQESEYKSAAQDVDLYAALIGYADAYTRELPDSQHKDRNVCLKKMEQAVFKQTRTIEAVLRELPVDYREPAEEKINQVKKIRLRAINDVLGNGEIIK